MPSGYTHGVSEGKVTEFKDFALSCARAFGALIEMRDDPADAPIPDEFKADDYHANALAKAKADLKELRETPLFKITEMADEEATKAMADWSLSKKRNDETRLRYEDMLEKVRKWTPPTKDHVELKKFMVEQLESSLKFDCSYSSPMPTALSPDAWKAAKEARLMHDVAYHSSEMERAKERAASRTAWVKALRESLKEGA